MHLLENLPAGPVGLRLLPLLKRRRDLRLKCRGGRDERVERLVGDDPGTGAGGEQERIEIEQPFEPAVIPGCMLEGEQFADIPEHPRAVLAQRDRRIGLARLAPHVEFYVHVTQRSPAPPRNLQPFTVELPRRHQLLAPRDTIDHLNLHAGVANSVAEFGREIAGQLLAGDELLRGLEQRADDHPRAAGGQLAADRTDRVGAAAPC